MTVATRAWPSADEVHVWQAALDVGQSELRDLHRCLSREERERADRCRGERLRVRHIAARGWLRHLLGAYVGGHPEDVVFVHGEHGKPRLAGVIGESLSFNVSHSEDTAVYAIAGGREVGIDVEKIRGDVPFDVVRRYFSRAEQDALAALPPGQQLRGFFEAWTRKEAYVKATGIGLSGLLNPPGEARWLLHSVDVGPGYSAAVAVAGSAAVPRAAAWLRMATGSGAVTRLESRV
ncbi:MAG: 4'-phosphopantetheinyl transferase family protein [Pseudonocardiaceae bacterium]